MFDFNQSWDDGGGDRDEELVRSYTHGLMAAFESSVEAVPILEQYGCVQWAGLMLDYAIDYIGTSPAEMTLQDHDEVVFDLFPRKVSVEPDQAASIIAELRAFWSFVSRQYGAANAPKILATLDGPAADRLRKSLADSSNFGMAKSFVTMGTQSGFDMTSQEGVAAFQAAYNARIQAGAPPQLPTGSGRVVLPPRPVQDSDEVKKKRKAKKRQRDAKKRNRR